MDHDVNVLKKILNSELFLGKYPMINRVWVDRKHNGKIDIVMSIKEPADEYWTLRDEINSFIYDIVKMTGLKPRFNIYP